MRHYASQKHHRRTLAGNKLSFGLRRHHPFSESHAATFIEKSVASRDLAIHVVTYVWTINRVRISPALHTSISIKMRLLTMDIRFARAAFQIETAFTFLSLRLEQRYRVMSFPRPIQYCWFLILLCGLRHCVRTPGWPPMTMVLFLLQYSIISCG